MNVKLASLKIRNPLIIFALCVKTKKYQIILERYALLIKMFVKVNFITILLSDYV